METQNDANVCDVQFSLRVPKSMAEEIAARAAAEGIKPASWIRKTLSNAINSGSEQMQQMTKADVLYLLQKDAEVQELIRKIAAGKDLDKESEKREKRQRKEYEARLDDFEKMRRRQGREIASMEKQIVSLERSLQRAEPEKVVLLTNELNMKRTMLASLRESVAAVEREIRSVKTGAESAGEPDELVFDDVIEDDEETPEKI
ncbi:MAG TPA: hypothetical protein O0X39_00700 [Methanocorpusculum sp.]|nr:hypothetical protein [Methanocorpusculum sp.]